MPVDILQRWSDPKVILAATNLHDQPALMRHAVAEARMSGARLLLVHVVPSAAQPEDLSASPARVLLLPTIERAADALDRMALQLQWQGVLCEPIVLKGRPDEQIQILVHSRNVDRVIVGARRPRSTGGSAASSLAEQLMAALPVPVCVVGSQAYPENPRHCIAARVLLALSLRSIRREYVDFACGLAKARRARLTLLHVIDSSLVDDRQRAHDAARLHLAALAANHDDLLWQPDIAVRDGDPASQIVEEAVCPFQDVIILGSSSLTPAYQKPGTHVIQRVLAEAHCPVITVKSPLAEFRAIPDSASRNLRTGTHD
jgi:nucleotide-binding universal stress UspA family protein